jgi:predicted amidohydrolase YtcJ
MDGKGAIKVFYNGSIYTKFDKKSPVESIVVKGDRIAFCGTSEESMKRYATIAEQIINLGGRSFSRALSIHIFISMT